MVLCDVEIQADLDNGTPGRQMTGIFQDQQSVTGSQG